MLSLLIERFAHTLPGRWYTGLFSAPGRLDFTQLHIAIPDLPPAFEGYKLLHLSDFHFGPTTGHRTIKRALSDAQAFRPDVIVISGDFVSYWVDPDELVPALRQLSAPDGVWAVLGNHDYWTDSVAVRQALAEGGVRELRNTHVFLRRDGEALALAGVDDVWEGHHDLDSALAGIPDHMPVILLAHEPDFADEAATDRRVRLQLSGHTHGGIVRVPGLDYPLLTHYLPHGQKYTAGLYRINGMQLYTSRGVGSVLIPRLFCTPEIVGLRLTATRR